MLRPSTGGDRALRILVVDGNSLLANSLTLATQICGHRTRTAYDGQSALSLFDLYQPDVVIAELEMPALAGKFLAEEIRSRPGGQHPVLIAHSRPSDAVQQQAAFDAGFDHFIPKPADPRVLQSLLDGIHEYIWLLRALRDTDDVAQPSAS